MAEYKDEEKPFEVWTRPLWDWAYDILSNPHLANHFRWDAERHYKFNGEQFERFIDEPWTADAWWEIQVSKKILLFPPFVYDLSCYAGRQLSQKVLFHFLSLYMQTKAGYLLLGQPKGILQLHAVHTFQLQSEMVKVLVEV